MMNAKEAEFAGPFRDQACFGFGYLAQAKCQINVSLAQWKLKIPLATWRGSQDAIPIRQTHNNSWRESL